MKRKLLFILIAAASCLFTACTEKNKPSNNEGEPENPATGEKCGEHLYWSYDATALTLNITGYGEMYDYDTVGSWRTIDEWGDQRILEIKQINLPDGLTHIGIRAFKEAAITNITIPNSVKTIGKQAFESSDLVDITIGEKCSIIGDNAFGSYSINRIICYATIPPALGYYPFYYRGSIPSFSVYVPKESVDAYKSASGWKEYNIIALP